MEPGIQAGSPSTQGHAGSWKDDASALAEKAKAKAVEGIETEQHRIAEMLEKVAGTLEHESEAGRWAAGFVRRGRALLESRSAGEMIDGARETLKARPAIVIGAALLGGFAVARLLRD